MAFLKQVIVCVLIGLAGIGVGWFGRMLIEPSIRTAKTATAQAAATTAAAQTSNTIEKRLIHDDATVDAAVARAKGDMRAKPAHAAQSIVCPAAGYVIAPVVEPDPDAEWRGYARGVNRVLDALGTAPADDDPADGAAGLPDRPAPGP